MSFPSEEGRWGGASLLLAAGQPAATPVARAEQADRGDVLLKRRPRTKHTGGAGRRVKERLKGDEF